MKYAICNETFLDWPHEKAFQFAKECGYTGIEIAPFTLTTAVPSDVREIPDRTIAEVKQAAKTTGLQVVGLHWLLAKTEGLYLTSQDEAVRERTADYLCELARLCNQLGGKILVLGSPQQRNLPEGMSHAQGIQFAADVLKRAMPQCENSGVTVAVEPLGPEEGNFLRTAASGIELIEMVDSPHCRLHLDCKAMSTEDKPIPDIIRDSADYMVHFHANDPNRLGPGMGEVDFRPIFAALDEVNYDGWVSVEVFDYSPGPERLAKESIDNMQAAQR